VAALLTARSRWAMEEDVEVTLEATRLRSRPRVCGVAPGRRQRLSLGVQALDDAPLRSRPRNEPPRRSPHMASPGAI